MKTFRLHLRRALRRMRQYPVYAVTIILCLALGIGANTAIFSLVNMLVLQPLPVDEADEVVTMLLMREGIDPLGVGPLDYATLVEGSSALESAGLAHRETFELQGADRPDQVEAAAINREYLPALGVDPIRGRNFTEVEDSPSGGPVALIGYGFWQRQLGGSEDVLEQTLNLDGAQFQVVGVLPEGFDLPQGTDLWIPLGLPEDVATMPLGDQLEPNYIMHGRLAPGATVGQLNVQAGPLMEGLAREYPQEREGWEPRAVPFRQALIGDFEGQIQTALYLVLAVVAFLLLIACANVASLLLIRSMERTHEMAIQTALGAKRRDLVSQLLVESVVLGLLGGLAGVVLAYWLLPPLMSLSPVEPVALSGELSQPTLDGRVMGFALLVSLFTALLFGLVPAVATSRQGKLVGQLKEGAGRSSASRGGRRLLAGLVIVEIAVAVMLLIGAGLTAKSFQELQETDLGFETANKLTLELPMSRDRYPEHPQRVGYVERLIDRVEALPGVNRVEAVTTIPLEYNTYDLPYTPEGVIPSQDSEVPVTAHRLASPGYAEMMGMRLVEGRFLTEQDRNPDAPVIVITEELARRSFPGESAVGKQLSFGYPPSDRYPPITVVGVVADTKEDRFNFGIDRPAWYLSYYQMPTGLPSLFLVVDTEREPLDLAGSVRQAVWEIDENQPIVNVKSLQGAVDRFLAPQRFSALLMAGFAVLGLILAAVGLYGLLSYWVAQSRREIGIRMAMGAHGNDLLKLALGRGLVLTVLGLAAGLVGGWILSGFLVARIAQLQAVEWPVVAGIALTLLAVGLLATYLPARRAVRVDPNTALRYE